MNHILIEGFMGSGKTAVAKICAKKAGMQVIDVGKLVVKRMNMSSGDIYDRFGEVYYRAMETYILQELAASDQVERSVIILSSAIPSLPQNLKYTKELGNVYYLKAKKATIINRLNESEKHKWIREEEGDLAERVTRLLKEREPGYKKAANVTIDVEGKTAEEIADEILAAEI